MKPQCLPTLAVVVQLAFSLSAQSRLERGDFDPARTWVFAISITKWANPDFPEIAVEGRADGALIDALKARGVPEDQIVYLREQQATRMNISTGLSGHLKRAAEGDTLVFYYQGHGLRLESEGAIAPADARPADEQTLISATELRTWIDESFRGTRVMAFVDCANSGTLFENLSKVKTRHSWAALSASQSSLGARRSWTFSATLVKALAADPWLDLDNNGRIELKEVAKYLEDEVLILDEERTELHLNRDFRPTTLLATCEKKPHLRVGRFCDARASDGKWYRARIEGFESAKFRVHYLNLDREMSETVEPPRIREPQFKNPIASEVVLVQHLTQWKPAKILKSDRGLAFVRYLSEPDAPCEWVGSRRLRVGVSNTTVGN